MSGWHWDDDNRLCANYDDGFVAVGTEGFSHKEFSISGPSFDHSKYDVVTGEVDALSFEPVNIGVLDFDTDLIGRYLSGNGQERFDQPVILRIDSHLAVRVVVDPCGDEVHLHDLTDSRRIRLTAPDRLRVKVGVELPTTRPIVTVPRSEYNLCRAISTAYRTTKTTSPLRTSPNEREPPAVVEWGDSVQIPDRLMWAERPQLTCQVNSLTSLAQVMPLVAYLNASVVWMPEANESLLVAGDRTYRLHGRPTEDTGVVQPQNVFQATFYLDCLAREPADDANYRESSVLSDLGLDAERLIELPMHRRVVEYLECPESLPDILDRFPDWHLSVSVKPTLDRLRRLVPFMQRLPVVYTEDDPDVQQSSVDRYSVPLYEPTTAPGRTHAWYADGFPTEGFKLSWRRDATSKLGAPKPETAQSVDESAAFRVVVVSNLDSTEEIDNAENGYREREQELPLSVVRKENLSPEELADVFTEDNDLIHFVGVCDPGEGLCCPGGRHFCASDLSETETSAFLLNAKSSYQQGEYLIERGATGGVVTSGTAVSQRVQPVGVTFARLVAIGWPLVTALRRAEAAHPECDTHFVVGDGTLRVAPSDALLNPTVTVEPPEGPDGPYDVDIVADQPLAPGAMEQWSFDDEARLAGSGGQYTFGREKFETLLDELRSPVSYDASLQWPDELR
jgi:hypothetical protein